MSLIDYLQSDEFEQLCETFDEIQAETENREEEVWESLDKETQLDVFCAVIRKLHKGEIEDNQSYRGILYDVFGFDLDSYVRAQCAGFLELHNAIMSKDDIDFVLRDFTKKNNINVTDEQIKNYVKRY